MSSQSNIVDEMMSNLRSPMSMQLDRLRDSQVANFYAGRSVFVTGATGFIGKALIEKLIRSCKDIKRVYLLIREKRGKSVHERLADLLQAKIFDSIRAELGDELLREKLHPIQGDITLPKLGIDNEDLRLVSADCSIVFNSAATIRFSEPIEFAVRNNIGSVGELVEFCNCLHKLEALVHLSTAYSNCHKQDTIHEIFYEPPMRAGQIQSSVEQLTKIQAQMHVYEPLGESADHLMHRSASRQQKFYADHDEFVANCDKYSLYSSGATRIGADKANGTPTEASANKAQQQQRASANDPNNLIGAKYDLLNEFTRIALRRSNRPNTYTLTKAISENYLLEKICEHRQRYAADGSGIPVAIVRPSIVGSAWREPAVGLVDNYNGPTGAILSLYTGALQAMPGNGKMVADLVPVDMVANFVLCAAWFMVRESEEKKKQKASGGHVATLQNQIAADRGIYIFNFVSGHRNPLRWHQVTEKIAEMAYKYPSKYLVRLPSSYFVAATNNIYHTYDLINQKLPAFLVDLLKTRLFTREIERSSSSIFAYKRIKQMTDTLTPFTSNQWQLIDTNVCALNDQLSPVDKNIFHFDVKSINWPEYLQSYIIGARLYTLRDEPRSVTVGMKKLKRLQYVHRIMLTLSMLLLFYLLFGSMSQSH